MFEKGENRIGLPLLKICAAAHDSEFNCFLIFGRASVKIHVLIEIMYRRLQKNDAAVADFDKSVRSGE